MPAKKRPQTKQENNKLYLERKKAKAVASSFEEALEAPASTQTVEVTPFQKLEGMNPSFSKEGRKEFIKDSIAAGHIPAMTTEDDIELPPPTNTDFDADDWEPYAPKADNVPLARGETAETAIKPGGWKDVPAFSSLDDDEPYPEPEPDPETINAQTASMALDDAEQILEDTLIPDKHSMPLDTVERLQQAAEAIKWLSQKARAIPPKTKEILRLRTERLEALIPYVK